MNTALLVLISAIVMLVGLIGTIVPILPGVALVWFGALIFFVGTGISGTGIGFFAFITVVAIAGLAASLILPGKKSFNAGASWSSVILGFVGALIGSFVVPLFGAIPGGIAGVYAGERLRGTGHDQAWSATIATIKGMGWAFLCQFSSALLIIGTFIVWVFVELRFA